MGYQMVRSASGEYAVDWEIVEKFTRSYWLSYYQLVCSSTVDMSESSWYNPFSWSMPKISTVEVEWDKVSSSAASASWKDMLTYMGNAPRNMRGIANEVKARVVATGANNRRFRETLRDTQATNAAAVQDSVKSYEGSIKVAETLRDLSADGLVIGSTIASGGLAGGAMLAGSAALKGTGKYQETGSVGAAALYGVGNLAIGCFKLGAVKKIATSTEYVLILAQGGVEASTSWVAGKSFGEGVAAGGLKVVSSGVAQAVFDRAVVKKVFEKMPLPFTVSGTIKDSTGKGANALVEKVAKKATEKGAKAGTQKVGNAVLGSAARPEPDPEPSSPPAQPSVLLDGASVQEMLLLYFAIVHMEKGIGRGW